VSLEEMSPKPLGALNMLMSDYVAGILQEEINTQIEELKGLMPCPEWGMYLLWLSIMS
jgi:hypothetical protein